MKNLSKLKIILFIIVPIPIAYGNIHGSQSPFDAIIEVIYQRNNKEISKATLTKMLQPFYINKINLNEASLKDLKKLYILTDKQILAILNYKKKNGEYISLYELQAVKGLDLETIKLLKLFIEVRTDDQNYLHSHGYAYIRYKNNIDESEYDLYNPFLPNYPSKKKIIHLGTKDQFILKFKGNVPQKLKYGFAARKNYGEMFDLDIDTNIYGFNSYSGSCEFQNISFIKTFIIGDYQFGCGQGLISSSGFFLKHPLSPLIIIKGKEGLESFQSFQKYDILRGLSSTINFGNLDLFILYSHIYQDACFNKDDNTIKTTYKTLIYNTQKSLYHKDRLLERIYGIGGQIEDDTHQANIGITFLFRNFDFPLMNTRKRNDFESILRGKQNSNTSLFGRLLYDNITAFGEIAISALDVPLKKIKALNIDSREFSEDTIIDEIPKLNISEIRNLDNIGGVAGALIALSKSWDVAILGRYYGPYFHSIRGNSIRQGSANKNEKGIYISSSLTFLHIIQQFYVDLFWFMKPTYMVPKPSNGFEWGSKTRLLPSRISFLEFKIKGKRNKKKLPKLKPAVIVDKDVIRSSLKYEYNFTKKINIQTHAKMVNYSYNTYSNISLLFAQDLNYKWKKIYIKGRIAFFDAGTRSEETIYMFEKNPLYDSPIPVGYRSLGQKICLLICYKPIPPLRMECKYAISHISTKKSCQYALKHYLTLQIMYKF